MIRLKRFLLGSVFDLDVASIDRNKPGAWQFDISANLSALGRRALSGLILLVLCYVLLIQLPEYMRNSSVVVIFVGVLTALAAVILVSALVQLVTRRQIVIDRGEVSARASGVPLLSPWTQPLQAFRGVRWRQNLSRSGQRKGKKIYTHVLELAHENEAHSFPVMIRRWDNKGPKVSMGQFVRVFGDQGGASAADLAAIDAALEEGSGSDKEADVKRAWEALAKQFELPAIDARHGREVIYDPSDLGKPLKDRLKGTDSTWSYSPPPWPLKAEREGEGNAARLIVTVPANFFAAIFGLVATVPALILLNALLAGLPAWISAPILAGAAALAVFLLFFGRKAKLTITRRQLSYRAKGGDSVLTEIALRDIQSVDAAPLRGELIITTRNGVQRICRGQPGYALRWLRDYIEAAVATA